MGIYCSLNSSLLYGGPLSLAISSGIPNIERILSITGMTAVPEAERNVFLHIIS